MSEEKLLPCAHCNGEAHVSNKRHETGISFAFYVQCETCGLKTLRFNTLAEAIAAWNRRAGAQWSAEPPTEKGAYWLMYSHLNQPAVATVSEFQYGANVYLPNGNMPKLNSFCKKHPEARWLPIATPPLPGKEDTK